jgi:hypothetical protein
MSHSTLASSISSWAANLAEQITFLLIAAVLGVFFG